MMAPSSSIATTLASTRDTLSSSQLLSSSITSHTSSRHTTSQISKIYRQSSTLFLTRRLPESLSTILPVISPPSEDDTVTQGSGECALVAKASRTTRIKVWSLYLTILNAILELDPEEGKHAFGSTEFRALVAKVRDGGVWEEVVANGYNGVEGDVDSDVVINLATLLLAHARNQKVNQDRLENYLAASTTPTLDINSRLENVRNGARSPSKSAGTDTPRDLNARVKILELYTLHVLLRNNEWDYAREFITISPVLDEERREAFLQALQSLADEQEADRRREREQRRYEEEMRERERKERLEEERARERARITSEEEDYGVEDAHPNLAAQKAGSNNGSAKTAKSKSISSPIVRASKPPAKAIIPPPPTFIARAANIFTNIRALLENMAANSRRNPMLLLQLLTCIIGVLMVVAKRNVRERIRKLVAQGFAKVGRTAGMGVKVSYI